jgi:tight adherence protein B
LLFLDWVASVTGLALLAPVLVARVIGLATAGLVVASAFVVRRLLVAQIAASVARRLPRPDGSRGGGRVRSRRAAFVPTWFGSRVEGLALAIDLTAAWRGALVIVVALPVVAAVTIGPPAGALVAACVGIGAAAALDLGRHRADRLVDAELPVILDIVSTALRSGHSPAGALDEAARQACGAARGDLVHVAAMVQHRSATAALLDWRRRRPTRGVRLAVAALALSFELGGECRPIDGVASTLRDRLSLERETRALSAQARASAIVMVVAPFVFVAAMSATDHGVMPFFLQSSLGFTCLAGGVLADAVGAWWMLHIVRAPR